MKKLPAAHPEGGLPGARETGSRQPSELTDKSLRAKGARDADAAAARAAGGGAKKVGRNRCTNQ